ELIAVTTHRPDRALGPGAEGDPGPHHGTLDRSGAHRLVGPEGRHELPVRDRPVTLGHEEQQETQDLGLDGDAPPAAAQLEARLVQLELTELEDHVPRHRERSLLAAAFYSDAARWWKGDARVWRAPFSVASRTDVAVLRRVRQDRGVGVIERRRDPRLEGNAADGGLLVHLVAVHVAVVRAVDEVRPGVVAGRAILLHLRPE